MGPKAPAKQHRHWPSGSPAASEERPDGGRRAWLYEVIFEADTPLGKSFDVVLLVAIVLSVAAVVLESVESVRREHGGLLVLTEWVFTVLFTAEYLLRLSCVRRPLRYARSFFGVIDLLAVLPTYVGLLFGGAQTLLVVRAFRLVRLFRVFKLSRYVGEAQTLVRALRAARPKITVFLVSVVAIVLLMGALMYLIEGPENGFTSIPRGVYWAVVTLTTVGYGDIAPHTVSGQAVASFVMILGYGIIAVPTGIVTAEMVQAGSSTPESAVQCPACGAGAHPPEALYCHRCGGSLDAHDTA